MKTNKNLSLNPDLKNEEITKKNIEPFFLKPVGKDYLWGGSRLDDDFSKGIEMRPLAETWECSTHPDGLSVIASGEFNGKTLLDVLENHPDYIGTHPKSDQGLPILIKLIDAKNDLSIQVHPDDIYAYVNENGSYGKTEMWYVLDATKEAKLVYGFCCDMTKDKVRESVQNGTIERFLQKIPIKKNDIFFIPAGQVHAICSGALVAEIQESSNITYRLYDYDRTDKNGARRRLNIEKALDVASLNCSMQPRQPMRVLQFRKGQASELLCRCKYFQVERLLINTERIREMAQIQTGSNSFQVLLCTEGCGMVSWNNDVYPFFKGDCIFIPANSTIINIHGKAQFLKVGC